MDTTVVVLAAGMGHRFGGLKQAEPITNDGKGILDFSIYDAIEAGFNKVVFIIRREIENDFKALIGNRISKKIDVQYVYQDDSQLPKNRNKPLGTGHAILCCKDVVKTPFIVINSDDYYGKYAFKAIHDFLINHNSTEYCTVYYPFINTCSKIGNVNRCELKFDGDKIKSMKEIHDVDCNGMFTGQDGKKEKRISTSAMVSMNIWGLTRDVFPILENYFNNFLKSADLINDEFYIQDALLEGINKHLCTITGFKSLDKWYGITYKEDLNEVKKVLNSYIDSGLYLGI